MQVAASQSSEYLAEQSDKDRRDLNRRVLLVSLVFATLLMTGLLSACATQYDGFEWFDKPTAALPARVHVVSATEVWRACRVSFGSNVAGCAIRDYTRGVCDIYVDGQWVIPHELKHCMGYDHVAAAK